VHHVGVLAYGSLVADPEWELAEATSRRIGDVTTPFTVEYARRSDRRGGAPTLAPVQVGGSPVRGQILVMHDWVTLDEARDRTYRRETRRVGKEDRYRHRDFPGPDDVHLPVISLGGIEQVVYTVLGDTIPAEDRNPTVLARRAIASVERAPTGLDGITYLRDAVRFGIETPVTEDYIMAILTSTGADDLTAAIRAVSSSTDGSRSA
jgi:hypothetical protein